MAFIPAESPRASGCVMVPDLTCGAAGENAPPRRRSRAAADGAAGAPEGGCSGDWRRGVGSARLDGADGAAAVAAGVRQVEPLVLGLEEDVAVLGGLDREDLVAVLVAAGTVDRDTQASSFWGAWRGFAGEERYAIYRGLGGMSGNRRGDRRGREDGGTAAVVSQQLRQVVHSRLAGRRFVHGAHVIFTL